MTSREIREKFLKFFEGKGHKIIPGAPLVPENDSTVLFTTAGMHPLVPYLLGERYPGGYKRLVNVQKSIRTTDIDEVGDNRHLTFFEMLGNWSLGDPASPDGIGEAGYWKKEAIEWSFDFLTDKKWIGFDPRKIYISVFEGDNDALKDIESIKFWQEQFKKAGINAEVGDVKKGVVGGARIFAYPKDKNWWGPAGQTGPCGPDTEMFYDTEKPHDKKFGLVCHPNCDCGRFIEIWNDVFMEYDRKIKITNQNSKIEQLVYEYVPLKQKNVDTGMGLERMAMILQSGETVFGTDLFEPIIAEIRKLAKKQDTRAERIIADHLRAAVFILGDGKGIVPSNTERGYVLRRLIRRAVRYGRILGMEEIFTNKIAKAVIVNFGEFYLELKRNSDFIIEQLTKEEEKFKQSLAEGIKIFERVLKNKIPLNSDLFNKIMILPVQEKNEAFRAIFRARRNGNYEKELKAFDVKIEQKDFEKAVIEGKEAFDLYQTYGFPIEMIVDLAQAANLVVDIESFRKALERHKELSRSDAEQKFKGGLADAGEHTTKLHTATHLLNAALRKVLGEHIYQKGSNITAERLRFDFSHPEKMTAEQIKQVEDLVNEQIQKDLPVKMEEMTPEEAQKQGAVGVFGHKYGEVVKVYSVGNFSKEICGGPHIERISVLGRFKIIKEEASSAGVRRIKAILEPIS